MTTENTRMQSVYEDDGQLTLGDLRALVTRCKDMDDTSLVSGSQFFPGNEMDVPSVSVLVVVEKTTT